MTHQAISDQRWQEAHTYLLRYLKDSDTVIAPDGFKTLFDHQKLESVVFQNYMSTTYLNALDFDWVVVHKGMIKDISSDFLDQVDAALHPVFDNDVFIIFSSQKNWLYSLRKKSDHLRAYYDIRKQLKTDSQDFQKSLIEGNDSLNGSLSDDQRRSDLVIQQLRHADALLCSYPKCGRTWLRFMLASYFYLLHQSNQHTDEPMDFRKMDRLVPVAWKSKKTPIDVDSIASHSAVNLFKQSKHDNLPLVFATHLSYSNRRLQIIFSSKKVIFLVRNIYDVLVSQYFELVHRRTNQTIDDVWGYICEHQFLESYVSYLNGWAKHLGGDRHSSRHIVVTYEHLKEDVAKELIQIIQFLNLDMNSDLVSQAIQLSSFENMQRLQRQKRENRGIVDDQDTDFSKLRIRRGKIGGYQDWLSDSAIQAIHQYCQVHLSPEAKELLTQNGLGW